MVNVPPLFLGLTLLFWGWEVNLLPVAIPLAVVVEFARVVRWRWDFSELDMRRVWDLCGILFIGAALYSYLTTDVSGGPRKFIPWAPAIFFPFLAATAFSAQDRVRLKTYFWLLRRKGVVAPTKPLGGFVPYWYLVVCFVAASIVNARDFRFYVGVVVLSAWLLWRARNRQHPASVWVCLFLIIGGAGYEGSRVLAQLQNLLEWTAGRMLQRAMPPNPELSQTRTALGEVGELKLSGSIVLRLQTVAPHPLPALLRKASFDQYVLDGRHVTWKISGNQFTAVNAGNEPGSWPIVPAQTNSPAVMISMFLPKGLGLLPLPNGPVQLDNLVANEVQTNAWGSVRTRDALPLVRFVTKYREAATIDAPPTILDLVIPQSEKRALAQVAQEIGLTNHSPSEVLQLIDNFFQKHFTYSSYLKKSAETTALSQFLLHDRAGHCEYFATAATLLLRQAGIPARYALGFAVPEDSPTCVVRGRDAHAWALAYVDGAWHDFDATPGSWRAAEANNRSWFEPLNDALAWVRYHFSLWRYYGDRGVLGNAVLWLTPLPVLWIMWRLFSRQRRVRAQEPKRQQSHRRHDGGDSEFYRIEEQLAQAGFPRGEGEPPSSWVRRLEAMGVRVPALREIVTLHYAYRFDPRGITAAQRHDLKSRVEAWLSRMSTIRQD